MSAIQRDSPKNVPQITEIHNHKKISSALHVFNSLVLDLKLRWYSEELNRQYFSTQTECDTYMRIVHNKPMDFTTIKKKIYKRRYNDSKTLFSDMELVFKNAKTFNTKGDTWWVAANRLHKILLLLKNKKKINLDKFAWIYHNSHSRLCPQCNNIVLPSKTIQPRRCGDCSSNIRGERMDCFICHNHSDAAHSFCSKCVAKWCTLCEHWHVGNCNKYKKSHTKKNKTNTNTNTNNKNRKANNNDHEWHVTKINLQVPVKPSGMVAVDKFERIVMKKNDILKSRIENIIKQIKTHDIESHFFKEVKLEGYAEAVTNPIHFGEILQRMNGNKYATMGHILRDINLLWTNCYKFNGEPDVSKRHPHEWSFFSNFAYDLQWAMNKYIKQFEQNLIKQGWIDTNMSCIKEKKQKHKKKHKHSKKNKSKRKNDDNNNRIAPQNNKFNKFNNKFESKTKSKKKNVLIPKKRHNNASILPTKKKKAKPLKHNVAVITDTKSTKKHIKSNKNMINNKTEEIAVIIPNASTHVHSASISFNNNNNNNNHASKTNNNKKIINDDDDDDDSHDSSVFSINNDIDLVSNSKAVDVADLLKENAKFYEMPSTNTTTQSTISNINKSKKKRNRASIDYFSSNSDDPMDNFDLKHSRKKAKLSSPPMDMASVSSTEKNNAPTIPITSHKMNLNNNNNNQIIPQKRPSQFGFTTAVNIKAPPHKKRKITTQLADNQSVYGIPNSINTTLHNLNNNNPSNIMNAMSVNGTNSVYPYPPTQHQIDQNIYNHNHTHHHGHVPLHHNNTLYSHHSSSINDTETQSIKITPHHSHHAPIHSSPSTYNPSLDSYNPLPMQHPTYTMLPHHPTSHNMIQPFTTHTQPPSYNNSQRLFLTQPQPQPHIYSTIPSQNRSKKRNKQTLKRPSPTNVSNPTQQQQPPPPQYTHMENPIEYYLGMAEHCIRVQQQQPNTQTQVQTQVQPNVNTRTNTHTQVQVQPYTVAGSLQPSTFNKSTVTTSTSSSINSQIQPQPQRIVTTTIPTISSTTHSNEIYPDNICNESESNLCQKIIKGIYSKAISIDMQDNLHPAKRFETIDKFPQPHMHGITPIAIFDIHQKIANNNQQAYKSLWEAYYDFMFIWSMQIHHNTDAADTAKKFNKYVDDVFNNVLNDAQMFISIKNKAHDKLQQMFADFAVQDCRMNDKQSFTVQDLNDKHSVTDAITVATVAYKRVSGLFRSDIRKKSMVAPNLKSMKRITSDDSDKPILAHINALQPSLPLQTQAQTQVSFYNGGVSVSVSPSVKSNSNSNTDKISVASSVSHVSRTSNAANNNTAHTVVSTPMSFSASVMSMSSNASKNKRGKDKKLILNKKSIKIPKRDPPKPKAPPKTSETRSKHKKSSKKKKSKKKHKSKKHKDKSKKKKASTLKTKPSTLKTKPKTPSVLRTKPAIKPKSFTNKLKNNIKIKPKISVTQTGIAPTILNRNKMVEKKKQSTSPISPPSPSPSPPAILMNKMQEMSDSESVKSMDMRDASPFLKPQQHHVSFAEHVPSPPVFMFDDNCSVNTSTTTMTTMSTMSTMSAMTTMSMGFNGRNPADLCKQKIVKINNNPFNKNKENNKIDKIEDIDTEMKDMEEDNDNSKAFNLFKIPKIAKKTNKEVSNEPLKIVVDSDDSDDDMVKKQIQDAHKREIADRIRRQKELKLKKEKEKLEKLKQQQEKLRKQKEKQQLIQKQKQKQKQLEKIGKIEKSKKTKSNNKNKRFTLKLKRNTSNTSKGPPLKPVSSILVVPTAPKIKVNRPVIDRTHHFGDHVLKSKRALTVYREFKRSATGKLFENENVLNGRFGIHISELIKHHTYSNRLIHYAIDQQQFINLPTDLQTFCHKLFDLCALSNNNNSNMLSIKFAKHYFNLLYKCFAESCDYQHRQLQHLGDISSDFAAAKWVKIVYELKEECIKRDFITLFKPFDPSIRPEQDAVIACAAVNLWRQANPITFFEIELKLQCLLYTNDASIKQDIQHAFDNFQDVFIQNERYRKFIEELRQKWVEYRTGTKFNSDTNDDNDNDILLENYSIFECHNDCIEYFADKKTKEQKLLGKELKIELILEDRIIKTRLDGDINFFYVKYVDFAANIVWEPRLYMLKNYREETKHYIRHKKVAHPNGDILLTHPNNLTAHKAFLDKHAGYIPRDREQFAPRLDISQQLRQAINRIAARKASAQRKKAKQANKIRLNTQSNQQKEVKEEIESTTNNNNDRETIGGNNLNVWKQVPSSSSCNDSSFNQQSNILNGHSISFSFSIHNKNINNNDNNNDDIDIDIDDDYAMKEEQHEEEHEIEQAIHNIIISNVAESPDKSQSIFSQNNMSTSSTVSGMSNNEIHDINSSNMNSNNTNNNSMDIDIGDVKPLVLSLSMQTLGSNDDEESNIAIDVAPSISTSLIPSPPPMPIFG